MSLNYKTSKHSFHLVDPSPWPMISGFAAFFLTFGVVLNLHGYFGGKFFWKFGLILVLYVMYTWWKDIVRESTLEGQHTRSVQSGIKLGVILFILSEVMFFFGFFWAFFHSSFNPSPFIGGVWPPAFLETINPWGVPLFNTFILLSSGATVTLAHHLIISGSYDDSCEALLVTILLATFFTLFQLDEYKVSTFSISDSVYGSCFFMTTGFHGFHVIIGTCFLSVCFFRLYFGHFTREHHVGFEAAAWYWHFVDVIWLFLFIVVYWWGGN